MSEIHHKVEIERLLDSCGEVFSRLRMHFSRMIRPGMSLDADDLLQETMVSVIKGANLFQPERGSFAAWVFAIGRNVFRRQLQKTIREARQIPLEYLDYASNERIETDYHHPVSEHDPLEDALSAERTEALRKSVEELPPQMRRALELRLFGDLKYREIAEVMGVSIETVKAHLYQSRQHLRDKLDHYFTEIDF